MSETADHEVTSLLQAWSAADNKDLDGLAPLVYQECIEPRIGIWPANIAGIRFKLRHLSMRRVLTDFARSRRYIKRGGDAIHLPFEEALFPGREDGPDIVDLDDALNVLASKPQKFWMSRSRRCTAIGSWQKFGSCGN